MRKPYRSAQPENTVEYSFDTFESIKDFNSLSIEERSKIVDMLISKKQLGQISKTLNLTYITLAKLMHIHERTIFTHKDDGLFSELQSLAVISIVDLYSFGYSVFSDPQLFNAWMKSVNTDMDMKIPIKYCNSFVGTEYVKQQVILLQERRNGQL